MNNRANISAKTADPAKLTLLNKTSRKTYLVSRAMTRPPPTNPVSWVIGRPHLTVTITYPNR